MKAYQQKSISDINLEDYLGEYEGKQATVDDMRYDRFRRKELLNGLWHYAVDQYDTCIRQHWFEERRFDAKGNTLPVDYSFDEWPVMQLPCCWNTQAEKFELYEGSMVFTRTFRSAVSREGERVFLKLGAVNYICRVFLNKQYLGMHRGGSTPAYFDVTDALREENRIIIQADSTRRPEQVPTENTDWFNYGGVYRDIELIRVPAVHIKQFRVALVPDGTFSKVRVQVRLSEPVDVTAKLQLRGLGILKEGICASEAGKKGIDGIKAENAGIYGTGAGEAASKDEAEIEIVIHGGEGEAIFEMPVELWTPERPYLYEAVLSCGDDTVRDEVGFREIRVKGHDILLNGKPVYLRGICCHEESVKNGKAPSDEERLETIRIAKELGCNFMRLAHYPHNEKMAQLADREGLLLWEEIPVYWAIRFARKATYEDAQNQLRELIGRDYNRASVIIWSVGNENADTDERLAFMSALAACAHAEDDTRMVSAACLVNSEEMAIRDRLAEHLDIIGINEYMGWYTPDFELLPKLFENSRPDKPVIMTELGADALPGHRGTILDKGTEDCQKYVYEKQIETIRAIEYVKGMTPWILFDFRCPRRTSVIQGYYNRKGLLSPDKTYRKPAFYTLQAFYREIEGANTENQ